MAWFMSCLRVRSSERVRGRSTGAMSGTRIVDAFLDLVAAASPQGTSMPAVAERAGISVRTLYRYFPTKDELQRYAAGWIDRRVREAMADRPLDLTSMREYVRLLWEELADSMQAVHVQHSTPEGRQMRAARLAPARAQVDGGLPPTIGGAAARRRRRPDRRCLLLVDVPRARRPDGPRSDRGRRPRR